MYIWDGFQRKEKLIFLTALGVIVAWFLLAWFLAGPERYNWGKNDFLEYDLLARNLLAGHGMSIREAPPYLPTALRLPGYPMLLVFSKAIVGNNALVLVLQIFMFALAALFTFRIAKILFGDEKIATISAFLMIFEIENIYTSLALMSDSISAALALVSFFYLYQFLKSAKLRDFLIGLVLISSASFIRPNHLLIVLGLGLVLFWLVFWRRAIPLGKIPLYALLTLVIVGLPFGGWAFRNYRTFGVPALVTAPYLTEFLNVAPSVKMVAENKSRREAKEELMDEVRNNPEFQPFPEINNVFYTDDLTDFYLIEDFTYTSWVKKRAREIFKKYPDAYRRVLFASALEFFTGAKWADPVQQYGLVSPSNVKSAKLKEIISSGDFYSLPKAFKERFTCGKPCLVNFGLATAGRLFWVIVSIGSFLGFIFYFFKNTDGRLRLFAALILGMVFYSFVTNVYFQGPAFQARYRMGVAPFLFMFSLYGLWTIKNFVFKKIRA